jgi:hypothetical protein
LLAQTKIQDHYIWGPDSVIVYKERSHESPELTKLPYGKRVDVLQVFDEYVMSSIPKASDIDNLKLPKTKWVQISTENAVGFLFLDQLSAIPVLKINHNQYERVTNYFSRNFILKDSVTLIKKYPVPNLDQTYSVNVDSISYENDAYALLSSFDGCSESNFSVPNWNFIDAYSFLAVTSFNIINSTSGRVSNELELIAIENDKYIFEDIFGFRQFYIRELNNRPIEFGWYSCD